MWPANKMLYSSTLPKSAKQGRVSSKFTVKWQWCSTVPYNNPLSANLCRVAHLATERVGVPILICMLLISLGCLGLCLCLLGKIATPEDRRAGKFGNTKPMVRRMEAMYDATTTNNSDQEVDLPAPWSGRSNLAMVC